MDAQDKRSHFIAANYAFLIIVTVAVVLRLYGRYIAHKAGFWWDDWLSLVALVSHSCYYPRDPLLISTQPFVWSICAVSLYWASAGMGKHIDRIPVSRQPELSKLLFVGNLIYNTGLTAVKMSVLLFYVRVFRIVYTYRIFFFITAALILGWFLAINFLVLFACDPPRKSWDPTTPGTCLDSSFTFLGATIPNLLIDLVLLVLPMPMVWKLQTDLGHKVALLGVFAAGYW